MNRTSFDIYGHEINACAKLNPDYFLGQWKDVADGNYESGLYKVMNKYVSSGTVCLDFGGYIGYTCLYMACIAKQVHAFEPDPVAFDYLSDNLSVNPEIKNLTIYNQAVGIENDVTQIMSSDSGANAGSSLLLKSYKSSWEVEVINVSDFVRDNCKKPGAFIKIDIEGFEYKIMNSLSKTLQAAEPTVLLSLHPQIISKLVVGNGVFDKVKRRLLLLKMHLQLFNSLRVFPYCYDPDGNVASLNKRMFSIFLKGSLTEYDKDLVLTFKPW